LLAIAGYERRWVAEDAYISLRVVRQILAGHGPVFNTGERVEAYTHPLWVAILSVWGLFGLPLPQGAVILGLLLSVVGLVAAQAGAARLAQHVNPSGRTLSLPIGALAFVAIPVVWDSVTSGLETGLSLAWLGGTFWLLVRAVEKPTRRLTLATAAVIGLGPLVRPDLAVFSAGFLASLFTLIAMGRTLRETLYEARLFALCAMALPVLYQIFRMGYFATLTPNTALAKEAGAARWSQGWAYLRDFFDPYSLWFPLLLLLCWWLWMLAGVCGRHDWRIAAVMVAPIGSALVHALYVVRVGGDFMHGRFLIPTLFGLLLPVMTVRIPASLPGLSPRSLVPAGGATLVVVWAVVAAGWLRVPYQHGIGPDGIADERGVYAENSGNAHPVTLDDYVNMRQTWPRDGLAWKQRAEADARVLIVDGQEYPLRASVDPRVAVVALGHNIGIAGYAAGLDVFVADQFGLADPLAGRAELAERGRPGHEKSLPNAWFIARFADPAASSDAEVEAARAALTCGDITDVLTAVDAPLTPSRFVSNIRDALRFHRLRIPTDPYAAQKRFCQ
jgi:arabinofuranosyltransferase